MLGSRKTLTVIAGVCGAAALLALTTFPLLDHETEPGRRALVPAQPGTDIPWGVATSHGSASSPARWLPKLEALGVGSVRGFSQDGSLSRLAVQDGLDVTGFLTWSTRKGPEYTFPVDDLDGWRTYVERTVRAQPQVRQWEIWNEPPNFTKNTSPAAYAQLVRVAYDAIKSVDEGLLVGLAAKSTDLSFLAEAIDGGAMGRYDFITLHPYERMTALFDGWDESFFGIVRETRAMLAVHDPESMRVPIDFTEMGSPAAGSNGPEPSSNLTPADQADALVKAYALAIAQGVRQAYWYDVWDGDTHAGENPFGLVAADGGVRPAYRALQNLIVTIGRRPHLTAVRAVGPEATILEFATARGPVLVAWSHDGASLRFGEKVSPRNAIGGSTRPTRSIALSSSPVLVRVPADGRFSWNPHRPTPAASASVSQAYDVSWSAGSGSNGLLVRPGRPESVSGRPALVVTPAEGLDLAVVPPGAYWGRSRLRVQVTARAVGPSAGFNLRYDAANDALGVDTAGQAQAGPWLSASPGAWQTFTWNVDSALLSGTYGSNLHLPVSPGRSRLAVSAVQVHVEATP